MRQRADPATARLHGDAARGYGLTPLENQQLGRGMMPTLDAFGYFFWRAAVAEDESHARGRS